MVCLQRAALTSELSCLFMCDRMGWVAGLEIAKEKVGGGSWRGEQEQGGGAGNAD